MKNFVKFMIALTLLAGAGTLFVTRGLDGSRRPTRFLEHVTTLGGHRIEASGEIAEERRAVGEFSRVELTGSGSVEIVQGDQPGVAVRADRNLLSRVETEVRDGTLMLGLKPGVLFSGGKVVYTVSAKNLTLVKTSGSGDIAARLPLTADELELRSEGSGEISAEVKTGKLTVKIAGSGDVDLSGSADSLSIVILGSGSVKAPDLSGRSADANMAGSGDVELGTYETLDAKIAGSGDVVYGGSPRVTSRVLGSGQLRSR
jgi:hypothetical protein